MTVEDAIRPRGLSNPHNFQEKHLLRDPGNHPADHFRKRMSPMRFAMRQYLTRFTDNQSTLLYKWQSKYRTKYRDFFFAYTSCLGSHTFYVICLPIPAWIGHFELVRDMVYILGYSIYFSGYLKDYWCLPRPRAPPLNRITLSEYTTMEYGAPSSHSANASGVTMLLIWRIWQAETFSWMTKLMCLVLVLAYYLTLVLGRIYCGMHGLLDLISGALVGIACFALRILYIAWFGDFKSADHLWYPVVSIAWGLFLLFSHVKPVDECPCFEDSVAFIGVVSGIECSDWLLQWLNIPTGSGMGLDNGFRFFVYRLFVGIPCVVIWKYVISKPLVYNFLIKGLKLKDDRMEKAHKHDKVKEAVECPLYIGEAKIDIIGRFIIYAGVPFTVVVICPIVFNALNIMS